MYRSISIPNPDAPHDSPLWDDLAGDRDPADHIEPGEYHGSAYDTVLGRTVDVVLVVHADGRPSDLHDARVAAA